MSTGEKLLNFMEYVTDRMNPILVKETRQALKSRQFTVTFMLLLTIAWLISAFGIMYFGPAIEYGSAGRAFFVAYLYVIGFATLFVVPFGAFRSMLNERDQNTYELLSISTLSPRQIVSGKLFSTMVQVFIYYSAIAPFIAFTSLLQGFDLPMVVLCLSIALLWSVFVSMVALMLSTLSNSKQWQAMNTIGMIILLLWQLAMAFGMSTAALSESVPFDEPEFWWGLVSVLIGAGSFFLLFQQIAVSRLTFESGNRSSGVRIICTLQFLLLWGGLLIYGYYYGAVAIDQHLVVFFASMSCFQWFLAGLFFSTESEHISRRVRRSVPQSTLYRVLIAPWMPGGRRGLVLLTFHMVALIIIAQLPFWDLWVHDTVTVIALYVICYVAFGAIVGRVGQRITPDFRPAHARVMAILIGALAMIAPYLPALTGMVGPTIGYSWTEITNPVRTLNEVSNGHHSAFIIPIMYFGASVALLVNLSAMWKGVLELVLYQSPAKKLPARPEGELLEAGEPQ